MCIILTPLQVKLLKLVVIIHMGVCALFSFIGGILCAVAADALAKLPSAPVNGVNVLCLAGLCVCTYLESADLVH